MLSDVLAAPALSFLPSQVRKGLLETTMTVGKAAASPIRWVGLHQAPRRGCRYTDGMLAGQNRYSM